MSDWSDAGECHDQEGIHRTSGRIYKLNHGEAKPRGVGDLTKLSGEALASLQLNPNDWLARQARRVLANRATASQPLADAHAALTRLAASATNEVHRLRALWALRVSGAPMSESLKEGFRGPEHVRAWSIRLLEDARHANAASREEFDQLVAREFALMSWNDPSPLVRLTLASLLQRLPVTNRARIAAGLLSHAEDANDHNVPLMIWYGIEPLAAGESSFADLVASARIPRVQRLGARRVAEEIDIAPARVNALLEAMVAKASASGRQAVLDGLAEGLAGRRKVARPASWASVEPKLAEGANEALLNRLRDLSALFGDGRALDEIRTVALNAAADPPQRRAALQALIEARAPGLREVCENLLLVRDLSATAAGGLALFDEPAIADRLLAEWPNLYGHERSPVLNALLSRAVWAGRLLEAISSGRFKRGDLGVFQARRIRAFNDPALARRLSEVWGEIRDVDDAEKSRALANWKQRLTPDSLVKADLRQGRQIFLNACASCHVLFSDGGNLGPNLTGADRGNLDYLLENLLFPSAIVPAEFRQVTLNLKDGRVLTGLIRGRTGRTVTLQSVGEALMVETSGIQGEETSALSLMPEGLLDALDETQSRNLIGFLMSKEPPARE